ncbi:HipA N-terminal domain-containing protein [Bradyrhizobium glycinis]|uniref:HipA N-terminal domain-containing protein n=1 Tax=Bradyrhizobium glycinis TaxID=2751812 RepID=UPI0035D654C8
MPLNVYLTARLAGRLRRESCGAIDVQYDKQLAWENAIPISVSLPLGRIATSAIPFIWLRKQSSLDIG